MMQILCFLERPSALVISLSSLLFLPSDLQEFPTRLWPAGYAQVVQAPHLNDPIAYFRSIAIVVPNHLRDPQLEEQATNGFQV